MQSHEKLADSFNAAKRALEKLKRSDRKKTTLQQRNLTLKATLHRIMTRAAPDAVQAESDVKASLREALALATERIAELEGSGEALLDALEKLGESSDSDEDDDGGEEESGEGEIIPSHSLVAAEVAFRGVLDDESYAEQMENWKELLED